MNNTDQLKLQASIRSIKYQLRHKLAALLTQEQMKDIEEKRLKNKTDENNNSVLQKIVQQNREE